MKAYSIKLKDQFSAKDVPQEILEMVIDFRKKMTSHNTLGINGLVISTAESFKFVGVLSCHRT